MTIYLGVKGSDGEIRNVDDTNGFPMTNSIIPVTFHNAATTAADGDAFTVGAYKTLNIEIYGTSTTRTVAFMGVGPSGTAYAISGVKLFDLTTGTSTTGTGELWQFDITGLTQVIMDITAVTGGNVTVKGKAVA
jgi:hypothetical protein